MAQFPQTSVRAVFETHGEDAWRAAELTALAELLPEQKPHIAALGGGTPMIPAAQKLIEREQDAGRVFAVYLRTEPGVLRQRLADDPGDRPSLTGGDPVGEIEAVLRERAATYEALADLICDTDERNAEEVGGIIAIELHRHHG